MNILDDDDSHSDEFRSRSRSRSRNIRSPSRRSSRSKRKKSIKLPNIGLTTLILYMCLLYIFYIVTKRHYDVKGTTITIKKLDEPLDIKFLEDRSIVPVFHHDEKALIEPMEKLMNLSPLFTTAYYIELDDKDRISALSPWDTYFKFLNTIGEFRNTPSNNTKYTYKPDQYRISNIPKKQLEYGKIVGLEDLKTIRYEKHDVQTLETSPIEVEYLNDILKLVYPSLKKFYKHGAPDTFVMSVGKQTGGPIDRWLGSGLFHQDIVKSRITLFRPYTRSDAKYQTRDIRMIIIDPDTLKDNELTEFSGMMNNMLPSHKRLDDYIDDEELLSSTGVYSSELPIDVIKLDKAGKSIIGILFDNYKIFHSVPRTSSSLFEILLKKLGDRTFYQIGFSDGFPGPMTAAAKNKKKKHTKKKNKSKSKKYKVKFQK